MIVPENSVRTTMQSNGHTPLPNDTQRNQPRNKTINVPQNPTGDVKE
jgi:hypothetical protein